MRFDVSYGHIIFVFRYAEESTAAVYINTLTVILIASVSTRKNEKTQYDVPHTEDGRT